MAKKQEILNTTADITKDILIPIILGGNSVKIQKYR
ncbi:hypothetical protein LSPH24S_06310 [Lysinibacillus sphaericus]